MTLNVLHVLFSVVMMMWGYKRVQTFWHFVIWLQIDLGRIMTILLWQVEFIQQLDQIVPNPNPNPNRLTIWQSLQEDNQVRNDPR